jgi:hypothetical protein
VAALSLGERVSYDGAFSSRRVTGEGFLPFMDTRMIFLKYIIDGC